MPKPGTKGSCRPAKLVLEELEDRWIFPWVAKKCKRRDHEEDFGLLPKKTKKSDTNTLGHLKVHRPK
jgi:hypothetical protein